MRRHRNPRPKVSKPPSLDNPTHRPRRPSKKTKPFGPTRSLLREHGIELAARFGSNIHAARSLNIILDEMRKVDRRRAMRLVEAVGTFVFLATKAGKQ